MHQGLGKSKKGLRNQPLRRQHHRQHNKLSCLKYYWLNLRRHYLKHLKAKHQTYPMDCHKSDYPMVMMNPKLEL